MASQRLCIYAFLNSASFANYDVNIVVNCKQWKVSY